MICRSMAPVSVKDALDLIGEHSLVEVRLEGIKDITDKGIKDIFNRPAKIVATCRPVIDNERTETERLNLLKKAVDAGAAYVDIEIESHVSFQEELSAYAKKCGCTVIVSYHNYTETPDSEILHNIVDNCFKKGADIAKLACMANSKKDAVRVLALLDSDRPIIPIAMGKPGAVTRAAAPLLGAPFTYAPFQKGMETAPGQLSPDTLFKINTLIES